MGIKTGIEWTDHTFNPWIGCTKVSPGCTNCYAKTRDDRHLLGPESHWGPGATRRVMADSYWRQPLQWAKQARAEGRRHKVFTASQADIFDVEAPHSERRRLWELVHDTSDALDYQILTKRPQRIIEVISEDSLPSSFFLDNKCWLGVSVENQKAADERITLLLWAQASVRFLSCEPLLEPVYLTGIDQGNVDWVIVGGESGPNARPMHPDWARSLRYQCHAGGVPFFFKQWGEWTPKENFERKTGKFATATWGYDRWFYADADLANGLHEDEPDVYRIGKHAAGSLLDGVAHKEFPKFCKC